MIVRFTEVTSPSARFGLDSGFSFSDCLRAMSWTSIASYFLPEDISFSIVHGKFFSWSSKSFIQTEAYIQVFKLWGMDKLLHSIVSTKLFIWNKCEMDCSQHLLSFSLQSFNCLNVLDPNTLHILSSSTIDISFFILYRCKRFMGPMLWKDRHNVRMGIE